MRGFDMTGTLKPLMDRSISLSLSDKAIHLHIIKSKGECTVHSVRCMSCKTGELVDCGVDGNNERLYKQAINTYIQLYGKDPDLLEVLL